MYLLDCTEQDSKDLTIATAVAAGQSEGPTHPGSKATAQEGAWQEYLGNQKEKPLGYLRKEVTFWGESYSYVFCRCTFLHISTICYNQNRSMHYWVICEKYIKADNQQEFIKQEKCRVLSQPTHLPASLQIATTHCRCLPWTCQCSFVSTHS